MVMTRHAHPVRTVRRFTDEERQILLERWHDPSERPAICEQLDRTDGSCRFEYYRLLKKQGITPAEYKAQRMQSQEPQSSMIENKISQLEESIRNQNDRYITQMENLAFLAKQKELIKLSALFEENARLKEELQMERDNNQRVFEELNFYLEQFFGLTSVEKLTSLKDFLPRIKTVVDQYGMVIGLTREGELHPFLQRASGN